MTKKLDILINRMLVLLAVCTLLGIFAFMKGRVLVGSFFLIGIAATFYQIVKCKQLLRQTRSSRDK